MTQQKVYLLEIATPLPTEFGARAAHVMGRQLLKTHLARVLLNDHMIYLPLSVVSPNKYSELASVYERVRITWTNNDISGK